MACRSLLCVLLAAALALPLAACGAGESARERLQESVRDAVDRELEREGRTTSDAVTADCPGGAARDVVTRCTVGVTVDGIAVIDVYRVSVDGEGCWRARRVGLRTAAGREAGTLPPHAPLRGCVG